MYSALLHPLRDPGRTSVNGLQSGHITQFHWSTHRANITEHEWRTNDACIRQSEPSGSRSEEHPAFPAWSIPGFVHTWFSVTQLFQVAAVVMSLRAERVSSQTGHRHRGGRPSADLRVMVLTEQLARENRDWGYKRIQGERVGQGWWAGVSTVRRVLKRLRIPRDAAQPHDLAAVPPHPDRHDACGLAARVLNPNPRIRCRC